MNQIARFSHIPSAVRGTTGRWRATHKEDCELPRPPNFKLKTAQASNGNPVSQATPLSRLVSFFFLHWSSGKPMAHILPWSPGPKSCWPHDAAFWPSGGVMILTPARTGLHRQVYPLKVLAEKNSGWWLSAQRGKHVATGGSCGCARTVFCWARAGAEASYSASSFCRAAWERVSNFPEDAELEGSRTWSLSWLQVRDDFSLHPPLTRVKRV